MRSLLAVLLCLGCISTNRATLDETAALFHDDLRWGRIPVAEAAVSASAREAFQQHHRAWGREVRVVDLDVDSVRLASTTGSLRVRVTWVGGTNSTDVRESVVEERWVSTDGNWRLTHEAVIAGDETLFPAVTPAVTPAATPAETPAPTPAPTPAAQKPTRPRPR